MHRAVPSSSMTYAPYGWEEQKWSPVSLQRMCNTLDRAQSYRGVKQERICGLVKEYKVPPPGVRTKQNERMTENMQRTQLEQTIVKTQSS